jgi:mannose-6-phosphate isomerase-like protein (cupin superfamily)
VELDVGQPIVLGPGQGESADLGAAHVSFKAVGEACGGRFSVTETTLRPGFDGPPPHYHEGYVDSFYVLEGMLTVRIGDDEITADEGSFVLIPPRTVHTFSNRTEMVVRVLNLMAPGGFEQYFREAAGAEAERLPEILERYDFHPAA